MAVNNDMQEPAFSGKITNDTEFSDIWWRISSGSDGIIIFLQIFGTI